jgi:hypothetical protein
MMVKEWKKIQYLNYIDMYIYFVTYMMMAKINPFRVCSTTLQYYQFQ